MKLCAGAVFATRALFNDHLQLFCLILLPLGSQTFVVVTFWALKTIKWREAVLKKSKKRQAILLFSQKRVTVLRFSYILCCYAKFGPAGSEVTSSSSLGGLRGVFWRFPGGSRSRHLTGNMEVHFMLLLPLGSQTCVVAAFRVPSLLL